VKEKRSIEDLENSLNFLLSKKAIPYTQNLIIAQESLLNMTYKTLILLPTLLLLSACFIIEDFGGYWEKGVIDPALEGYWGDEGKECFGFIRDGSVYKKTNEKGEVKTLQAGTSTFLMDKNGEMQLLYKYKISGNTLALYFPEESKRQEFFQKHSNDNLKEKDNVFLIKVLNKETVDLLANYGAKPDFWHIEVTHTRRSEPCPADEQ
tara:strand:+ start:1831 stop:2451 length:621 start_codon:yes stop_codon:yes gene_type:complete